MTSALKCLLIEDEPRVARFITDGLLRYGHSVVSAGDGETGLGLLGSEGFSVLVLDVGLPGRMDGFEVARRIRASGIDTPLMMLTALSTTDDIVRGLECGADDYVVKPFVFAEFEARLRALARRRARTDSETIQFGPLELDPVRRVAFKDGALLSLTPTEFRLLHALVARPARTVSRPELLATVWGIDFDPGTRIIDVHVANLRRKLEDGGYERMILTERGVGFRAVEPAPVSR